MLDKLPVLLFPLQDDHSFCTPILDVYKRQTQDSLNALNDAGDGISSLTSAITGTTTAVNQALADNKKFYTAVSDALDSALSSFSSDSDAAASALSSVGDLSLIHILLTLHTLLRSPHPVLSNALSDTQHDIRHELRHPPLICQMPPIHFRI